MCPSEAPPAARGRSHPPNTLPLVRFGRGSGGAAGISCHRPPSLPSRPPRGGHAAPALVPGTPKGPDTFWGQSRDPQRLLSLGRQVALLQRDTSSSTRTSPPPPLPAVHILLEKISLLRFQVRAKTRLKNVQNAVFASFPLCISQHVLQTGHFLIVSLWLSHSGIRERLLF